MSIDAYGRARPIEGGGFEEKKCCMQHKRCITFMPYATSPSQKVAIEAYSYWIFLKDNVLEAGGVL